MDFSKFGTLHKHNMSLSAGSTGTLKPDEVRRHYDKTFNHFVDYMLKMRTSSFKKENGFTVPGRYISLEEGLANCYGLSAPANIHPRFRKGWVREKLMNQFGMTGRTHKISDMAEILLGTSNYGIKEATADMISCTKYNDFESFSSNISATGGTEQVPTDYRFLIPEFIMDAITVGYENDALYTNWTAVTNTVTSRNDIILPQIRQGDTVPYEVAEGADIPFASLQFGQKKTDVRKRGVGLKLTDELITQSTVDMMATFIAQVGVDMGLALDSLAMFTLINGEQSDGSESAPVVGVDNVANGFTYKDAKRVFTRMKRLGLPATRMITREDDGIDITEFPEFKGGDFATQLSNMETIIGVPDRFQQDVHLPPPNQAMYLSPNNALMKMDFRGMTVEERRNPQNQTNELFISETTNFAIIRKDARVLQDKTVTFTDFPESMDIDSRIAEQFKNICS